MITLSQLFTDLKLQRRIRMIDEAPQQLRSTQERVLISEHIQRLNARLSGKHKFKKFSAMMEDEERTNPPSAYDCSIEQIF